MFAASPSIASSTGASPDATAGDVWPVTPPGDAAYSRYTSVPASTLTLATTDRSVGRPSTIAGFDTAAGSDGVEGGVEGVDAFPPHAISSRQPAAAQRTVIFICIIEDTRPTSRMTVPMPSNRPPLPALRPVQSRPRFLRNS